MWYGKIGIGQSVRKSAVPGENRALLIVSCKRAAARLVFHFIRMYILAFVGGSQSKMHERHIKQQERLLLVHASSSLIGGH